MVETMQNSRFNSTHLIHCNAKSKSASCQPYSFSILSCFWAFKQTTLSGTPSSSSHSPGPNGITCVLSSAPPLAALPTLSLASPTRPSFQFFITSSITTLTSSSKPPTTFWIILIHCRSCRGHLNGSPQSSSMVIKVFGMVFVVNSRFSSGAKAPDGSESMYIERRARMSSSSVSRMSWYV